MNSRISCLDKSYSNNTSYLKLSKLEYENLKINPKTNLALCRTNWQPEFTGPQNCDSRSKFNCKSTKNKNVNSKFKVMQMLTLEVLFWSNFLLQCRSLCGLRSRDQHTFLPLQRSEDKQGLARFDVRYLLCRWNKAKLKELWHC